MTHGLKALAFAAALLTGCASQPERVATTPWPQAVINAPKQEIHEKLVAAMASAGATIESAGDSVIQCRIPDADAGMAKAFFGCPACADPYLRFNTILSAVDNGTQVVMQYWRVIPKANGSEERMEITNNYDFNQAQQLLWKIRDSYGQP